MQQTDFPIELLIGEDCSTDDTRDIAMRYQREHPNLIRIITSSSNVGARKNRHRVTRSIRGEFMAFCEGDDYWTDPAKLQLQVDYLRAHPDAGAVHSDFDRILLRSGRWPRLPNCHRHRYGVSGAPAGDIFATLLRGNFILPCTLCVRANLDQEFIGGGFLKDSYPVGDWPLCLYIAAQSKIGYLDRSLAVYRKVPGSMMNSGPVVHARTVAAYVPMIEDFCDFSRASAAERTALLAKLYRDLFWFSLFADDMPLFARTLSWLRQHDPTYLRPIHKRLIARLAWIAPIRKMVTLAQGLRQRVNEWFYLQTFKPQVLAGRSD
jgi:glycosyltransferase involved in cell wall biosynthesis